MSSPEPARAPASKKGKKVQLEIFERASSVKTDGSRPFIHPADVSGRFSRIRTVAFYSLLGIWAILPWIQIGGRPAVFLDVSARRFFLFGASFDSSSFWLAWFLLSGVLFALMMTTTAFGRVWCGYACPQTVFLEGVFRKIERFFEGNRNERIARDKAPWTAKKLARRTAKHSTYILAALLIAHVSVAYFVSMPSMLEMMSRSPLESPYAFAWIYVVAAALYGNFAWFREQLCLVICPYGRLQSALIDEDSIIIGYDEKRGEPRGKGKRKENDTRGDCVDCDRCVVVCPTGIDIRNGLQVDCIGCALCIDACDDVMTRIGKPKGLIRYDSLKGLRGEETKFWRPRMVFYVVVAGVLASAAAYFAWTYNPVQARMLRLRGLPYVMEGDTVRNGFEVHVVNDSDHARTFEIDARLVGVEGVVSAGERHTPSESVDVPAWADRRVTVVVRSPHAGFTAGGHLEVTVRVGDAARELTAPVLGPSAGARSP